MERFRDYLAWMKSNGYRGIALRDLGPYVEHAPVPADPWAVIQRRQAEAAAK